MDAKKRSEELASKLDCTWNGEQGRWVSENLIKMAIEEAKREERERCAKIVEAGFREEWLCDHSDCEYWTWGNYSDAGEHCADAREAALQKRLAKAIRESEAGDE